MKHLSMTKGVVLAALMVAGAPVMAASWQDQLSSAANQLSQTASSANTASSAASSASGSGLGLGTLTSLLNGSDSSLSSSSMSNAAGILGYCAKQKLASVTDTTQIKNELLSKLGMTSTGTSTTGTTATSQDQKQDYLQGLAGLLSSGSGKTLDLKSLGDTELGQKVKTKACDLVLKQGSKFLL
ncbi:hypothetical protein TUM12370_32740 [Salmonella enterica subsp. enterica serovar Choleraesuis]|nr:hypothetical protein TUM12370_32740 [Salmonella enterica subsp. enterica serovar Choleraesuis]